MKNITVSTIAINQNQTIAFNHQNLETMKNLKILATSLFLLIAIFSTVFATNSLVPNIISDQSKVNMADVKPSFEEVSICRLQLKVKTNSIKDANTDSPVSVKMNQNDAPFFLNLSHNDREKNHVDVYDVVSSNINKIKNIEFLKLVLKGKDGWNIKELEILVNGVVIFKESYASGYWLDTDNSKYKSDLTIKRTTLRKHPNWKYNNSTNNIYRAPAAIPVEMLKRFVESAVGNSLYYVDDVTWGKKFGQEYVSVKRISDNTLRFDLDLEYDSYAFNSEVDVDFDLLFTCSNGVIVTQVKNMKITEHGINKYLRFAMDKLEDVLMEACSKYTPVPTFGCKYGLNKIAGLLDFNFDYAGPGNVSPSKACTGELRLDAIVNLIIGNNNPPSARNNRLKANKMSGRGVKRVN